MISFNLFYRIKILELQIMVLMLVLLHMFSIYANNLKFTANQGRRVEFKSVGLVPEGVVGYAVVSTKKH